MKDQIVYLKKESFLTHLIYFYCTTQIFKNVKDASTEISNTYSSEIIQSDVLLFCLFCPEDASLKYFKKYLTYFSKNFEDASLEIFCCYIFVSKDISIRSKSRQKFSN